MSHLDEYRRTYPAAGGEPLTPADLIELRNAIRALDRKVERLLPATPEPREALDSLDKKCCRLRGAGIQLHRLVQALAEDDDDEGEPRFKRRLCRVTKGLTTPAESQALLREARAALSYGEDSFVWRLWCERRREHASV